MPSNNSHQPYIKIVALLLVVSIFYFCLVVSDYLLRRYITSLAVSHTPEAKKIIDTRMSDDLILREQAVSQGYNPMIYPESVESYPALQRLAVKLNVAPLAPQPHSKLYFCNEGYGLIKYVSDKFGFRNEDQVWKSGADLLLIGDSFIHGACVREKDTIAGVLQGSMNVVNLGTAGNGPLHYAALSKNFIPHLKPKNVVLTFYANDNGIGERGSIYFQKYFVENKSYFDMTDDLVEFYKSAEPLVQTIVNGGELDEEDRGASSFYKILKYMKLPTLSHQLKMHLHKFGFLNPSNLHFSSKLAIDTAKEMCDVNNCRLYILWIPNSKFWHPDEDSSGYADLLRKYSMERNIVFLDAAREINEINGNRGYAEKGPHLSPLGYKTLANYLSRHLQR
jgi:hypothetical protein